MPGASLPLGISFLAAFGLGVLHALEPSHGKPLLLLQMVSGRMSWKRSFFIIITSVITHFLMVGSLTVLLSTAFNFGLKSDFLNGDAQKIFGSLAGALLIVYGFWLWKYRHQHCHPMQGNSSHKGEDHSAHSGNPKTHSKDGHPHSRGAKCTHHNHTRKQDFFLGFSTGILPCPTSWVVVSNAINVQDPILALSWLSWFCLGMTVVLLGLGALIAVGVSKISTAKLQSHGFEIKLISAQAILIIMLGFFQLLNSVVDVHHHETESDHAEVHVSLPHPYGAS